jgi:hypothetical protein
MDCSAARFSSVFMTPNMRACVGHVVTQGGPSESLSITSRQRSHFCIIPSAPNCGTSKGHASKQVWHPEQASLSTTTIPSSGRFLMASSGHTSMHAGSAQCMHPMEADVLLTFGYVPCQMLSIRLHRTPNSTPRQLLHATSHPWHWTHLSFRNTMPYSVDIPLIPFLRECHCFTKSEAPHVSNFSIQGSAFRTCTRV